MIIKFLKSLFKIKKQEVLSVVEIKIKPQHCTKHNRYRKNCLDCREVMA